ncbi:MAG: hypothetical protein HYV39_02100 [Candidatus Levybacteria bacterium]|nr:hypothetical protein [Candidatus Levybacteria bacterium]
MGPDEAYKNKIGERVMRRVIEAFKNQEINENELSTICSYILDNIDNTKSNAELVDFLSDLSKKWPMFSQILIAEHGGVKEENEKQVIDQVSTLIKENKIEEAIQTAGDVTKQTGGQI